MTLQVVVRTAFLTVLASVVIVFLTLSIGHQIETSTITEYITMNGVTYTMQIRDLRTKTSIRLAGTRCFAEPPLEPEWIAVRQQYQPNYMQELQVRSFDTLNAVNRLRCL